MKTYRFTPGPVHLLRLTTGMDVTIEIERYAAENDITVAWVTYLGAVQTASLRYYHQTDLVYEDFLIERPLEVLTGVGNISLLETRPFLHTHAAFGDRDGRAFGGHVNRGTLAFSLEVQIQELVGDAPERLPDDCTGLATWGGTLPATP